MALRSLWDLPAPAKINLFLHIVGRRDDGYHLLQSPFVLIDWADTLHVERRCDGGLHRHDLGEALPREDLCLRAARALQQASGTPLGADIHIDKRVPAGAGLGGGSSDAATTLLALNRLWGLHWPRSRLAQLGLALGADVPFFIGGDNAFVEGIGEKITPIVLPPADYAVVWPGQPLSTQDVFTHPAVERDSTPVIVAGFPQGDQGGSVWQPANPAHEGFGHNGLQRAAEARCPAVAQAARWLNARFGNSRMSGSGSAVFARAEGYSGASLDPPAPGWKFRMCRSLASHPLRDWAS
jgi:4-diphosphocytidyl-2-C-methyl-D-erythritol kinase